MKKRNEAAAASMVVAMAIFLAAMVIMIGNSAVTSEAARVFKVGDDFGWQEPTNNSPLYTQWATTNRFQVGDSLLFEYKNDSVAEVDKWGYYHCNTSTATAVFDNGRSSFKLEQPGPFYFISGNSNHCNNGQLLVVEVMSLHHHDRPSLPPQIAFSPTYAYPPEGSPSSSSTSSMVPSESESRQHSSAVIVSVIVSSVTVVLIATFVGLYLCAP